MSKTRTIDDVITAARGAGDEPCVWVGDAGGGAADVLIYATAEDCAADRDNSGAAARLSTADGEALIAALIDAGIDYERG